MGILGKLLGGLGVGSAPPCPSCGATLDAEDHVAGSYWCESCGSLFKTVDGELFDAKSLRSDGGAGSCETCQSSLSGGTSYLPYENGSNPHAYIVCPSCGHENIRYGFGEDDD
jgi:ribosomal protein L37AE/L43A